MEGARAFSVMSIAKFLFSRILGGQDVLGWCVTLPGLLVPAVEGPPSWWVKDLANPLFLSLSQVTWALKIRRRMGGLWTSVTQQLLLLSWISLDPP